MVGSQHARASAADVAALSRPRPIDLHSEEVRLAL